MPGRDRTGPMGYGPATGGGWGSCTGRGTYAPPGAFAGRGRGGGGRGWRHVYYETGLPRWARTGGAYTAPPVQDEMSLLRAQAQQLQAELADIERRLQALGAAGTGETEPR